MQATASPDGIANGPMAGSHSVSGGPAAQYAEYQNCAFHCPSCGISSTVRWDKLQLGKVLACPRCQKNFTVKGDGRLNEVIKDRQGRWKEARAQRG